jgi:hypothetical protein
VTKSPILKYCSPEITAGVIMDTPPAGRRASKEVEYDTVAVVSFPLLSPVAVAEKVVVAPPESVLVPAAVEPEVGLEVFVALLLDCVDDTVVVSLGLLALV